MMVLQKRLETSEHGGSQYSKERQCPSIAVHTPHVPGKDSLACESKLQGVLACEGFSYKL